MIESEDTPTLPYPTKTEQAGLDTPSTIQVPVEQVSEQEQSTRPPTLPYMGIEDLLALRLASDPQISSDGTLIAFTVQHCDEEKNRAVSSIWLVDRSEGKTSPPRQLTSGNHHNMTPRWSPDGRTLAFISDRTGTPQIYLLPMDGGEAHQLSTLQQGVTEYSWRPDGSMLLAHSGWKPEDDQSTTTTAETVSIYTRLDAQWDGEGYRHGHHQQLWLIDIEGQAKRLTSEPVDLVQSCWSPDGTEIVFCANRRSDPDLSVSMALWLLTVGTGQMRRLTPEEELAQMPSWSPDGNSIAYLYSPDQTETSNISPRIIDVHSGTPPEEAVTGAKELTCQSLIIDELRFEWLMRPQWYPDGKSLLVPIQERGQIHLCRLDREHNKIIYLTKGNGRYLSPHLSQNGKTIALVRADWFTPGDVWSMDSDGTNQRKLTKVNDNILQSRQLIRPRRITWESTDGLTIEGWLYLPPLREQTKAPTILVPHGGPSLAWGDSYVHEFQVLAGRGYAILAPNPRGSAGYGEEFCRKVLNDWGGNDFHDLMVGLDHVIATEPVDEQRLGIGGISYGGYMTNWAITQTNRFKAAVSRNGISSLSTAANLSDQTIWFKLAMQDENLQRERSAFTFVDQISTPLLLLHAKEDLRCPFSESLQLFMALRKRKQPVELVGYHHASHLMDWPHVGTPQQRVDRLRRTISWFERFV